MSRLPPVPIPLTADHLARGLLQHCLCCPVALALYDATGRLWHVTPTRARLEDAPTPRPQWRFPKPLTALILAIDRGENVAPTTVWLPGRFRRWICEEEG